MPAGQDALGREPGALDAGELARMTGPRLQALLSLPAPLPAQEERAALLREVCARFARSDLAHAATSAYARMPDPATLL